MPSTPSHLAPSALKGRERRHGQAGNWRACPSGAAAIKLGSRRSKDRRYECPFPPPVSIRRVLAHNDEHRSMAHRGYASLGRWTGVPSSTVLRRASRLRRGSPFARNVGAVALSYCPLGKFERSTTLPITSNFNWGRRRRYEDFSSHICVSLRVPDDSQSTRTILLRAPGSRILR